MVCLSYSIYNVYTHDQYVDLRVGLFIISMDHELFV